MKQQKWIAAPIAAAIVMGLTGVAQAQPALNQGAGQNPPNNPVGGNRPDWRNMTPEQRQQFMQQMRERNLRRTLEGAGFTDQRIQTTIVQFSDAQNTAREQLQTLSQQLVTAVSTPGTPDDRIAALLKQFQDAVAAEKERQKTDTAKLDELVGYSKQPRLNALLTTMGLIGDEALLLGGRSGFGGFGGFGGQR